MRKILILALSIMVALAGCGEKRVKSAPEARPSLGRVIVVGFDGLEPTLVEKWVGKDELPNFKRLIEGGAFGGLMSVLPPSSAPAWTSAVTGVNPGKHGIYGFLAGPVPGFYTEAGRGASGPPVFSTSDQRGFKAVWEVLGNFGRRSTLINIPLTSPADSLNGLMVAGFPHASDDTASYYWPPSLAKYLGDYVFDAFGVVCAKNKEGDFIADLVTTSTKRLHLGLTLFDETRWDLFWLVFTFTDRYQHYLWKYMDENHPMYDADGGRLYGGAIEAAYKMADTYLGEFMNRMQDDDLLVVMSDHGFGPAYHIINSHNFLFRTLGPAPEVMCADFFGCKFRIAVSGPNAEEKYASLRDRLAAGLAGLEDPASGTRVVDSVYVKEQVYKGLYLGMAPDVVGQESDGYLFFTLPRTPDLRFRDAGPNPDQMFSGFHRRRGTIGLYGKYVRPGQAVEARIVDIAPIILSYLGVPAPAEIDGKVPAGVFSQEIADRIKLVRSEDSGYRKPRGLGAQDAKKIEKQLRAVGYIQ